MVDISPVAAASLEGTGVDVGERDGMDRLDAAFREQEGRTGFRPVAEAWALDHR